MTNDRLEFPDGAIVMVVDSPDDTAGAPLVMEFFVPPGAMPIAAHVHPRQEEAYAVRAGTMEVLVGSSWSTLEAGQSATVPAGTPHAFRNRSEAPVRFINEHRPALRFEEYFRAVHGLSETGKIKGGFDVRGVLYACVLMDEYGDTMQPVDGVQRVLIGGLAAVGRMLGYESRGPEASDPEPASCEAGSAEEDFPAKVQNVMMVAVLVIVALALSRRWSRRLGRR